MKKVSIFVIVIVVAVAIAAGIYLAKVQKPSEIASQGPQKIIFGYRPILPSLDFFVALEKGFFKEENLDVQLVVFRGSSDLTNAIINGNVNFASDLGMVTQLMPTFRGEGEEYPLKFLSLDIDTLSSKMRGPTLIVKKGAGIKTVSDLKNKDLAIFPGINFKIFAYALLKDNGLTFEDVNLTEIPPQEQVPGFKSVDALISLDPIIQILEKQGVGKVLEDHIAARHIVDPFAAAATSVNTQFAKEHPDIVRKVIRAISKGIDETRNNPEYAREVLAKYTKLSPELARIQEPVTYVKYDEIEVKDVQNVADYLYSIKWLKINKEIDAEKLIWKE